MILCTFFTFLLLSCEKDYYVRRSVSLHFAPTTQVNMLHAALNDLNAFVTIRIDKGYYVFCNAAGEQARWPMSKEEIKTTYVGLSGFIVGRPTLGDGKLGQNPTCFELACPLCYKESHITHDVSFDKEKMGVMRCSNCQTIYDLNMASPGLDRYVLSYTGSPTNSLTIR